MLHVGRGVAAVAGSSAGRSRFRCDPLRATQWRIRPRRRCHVKRVEHRWLGAESSQWRRVGYSRCPGPCGGCQSNTGGGAVPSCLASIFVYDPDGCSGSRCCGDGWAGAPPCAQKVPRLRRHLFGVAPRLTDAVLLRHGHTGIPSQLRIGLAGACVHHCSACHGFVAHAWQRAEMAMDSLRLLDVDCAALIPVGP